MDYLKAVNYLVLFQQNYSKDSNEYKAIQAALDEVQKCYERIANVSEMLSKTVDEKLELKNELFYLRQKIKDEFEDFENINKKEKLEF